MIILQAGAENGCLHLWGECPADVPPARAGRKSKAPPEPLPYPFDAGLARLAGAFLEALPGHAIPGGGTPPVAWLPTVKGRPVPSNGLIADVPTIGEVTLDAWKITSFPLSDTAAVELLCGCVGKDALAPGMMVGVTLAFWARVLRFAGGLVARELFVPGMRTVGKGWRACWQPVIAGPDGQRLAHLVQAMPPACRALSASHDTPPDRPPGELLNDFLLRITDTLIRQAIVPPTPPGKGGRIHVQTFNSLHDQWLHALTHTPDGVIHAPEPELTQLAAQVRSWQRPIRVSSDTAFGLCFRLEEPPESAPPSALWKVTYLLQARDDPSLYIPASEAWNPTGKAASLFQARSFEPREFLLTGLGQAAGLCPPIERSLKSDTPSGFELESGGAHLFLTEGVWLLEQSGFAVLVPGWWGKRGTRAKLSAKAEVRSPEMSPGGGVNLDRILTFDWKVALGDDPLTLEELQALARHKAPLVKVRGQWVQVHQGEIRSAIALIERQAGGEASLRDVIRMALGGAQAHGGLPFSGVRADGWVGEFLSRLEGKADFEEIAPAAEFKGSLRPYQLRGTSWLAFLRRWGMGACLADDMGLGKTVQTLALLQREWHETRRPTLLICPTSVVANWRKEAERFTPDLPVLVHHGGGRTKGEGFAKLAEQHALVLSSYALLARDRADLEEVKWSGIVLDEAQNIKNPQTKQAQAARALPADFRIALTGTPVENHVGDLWSILEFLNPGWLGTQSEFRRRYFVPIQANQDAEAAAELKRLTGPFILRRMKTDKSIIADLPDKLEMKVYCNLTREQATLYAAVVEELNRELESAEGIQRKGLILTTLMRLKQVCNHPAHFLGDKSSIPDRSGKLTRLAEMLDEVIQANEKSLVFTQFAEMGEILKGHLQETFGKEVLFLHGGTPAAQRQRMVERFQTEEHGPRVFVLSLKAGGTGLNLTGANHVFHFDRWWNPAVEDQATDRAFRIGQTRDVQVHKFVCVGTVEEKIDDMIERKQAVARQVVKAGEAWLTEMSNEQLRDLFELRQNAIGEG